MINSDFFTTSECCISNNYVFMKLNFQVTFIDKYLIKIEVFSKLISVCESMNVRATHKNNLIRAWNTWSLTHYVTYIPSVSYSILA